VTRYTCRTLEIALEQLQQADDGDTLLLVWRDATNAFSRAIVESRALALGLDVVVVVAPEVATDNKR